jgi:hypothetical protein
VQPENLIKFAMDPLKSSSRDDYIFAQGQRRERTAINRLIAARGGALKDPLNLQLRWGLPWAWLGLRVPQRRLLRGIDLPAKKFLGDVDVFGAPLQPLSLEEYNSFVKEAANQLDPGAHPTWHHQIASQMVLERRHLKWPPDLDYMAASEVKVAYYGADDTLKGTGSGGQKSDRTQARHLCEMGFDRVALSRILVTEPIAPGRMHPWMEASARSSIAGDEFLDKGIWTAPNDPFGTLLVMQGAVPGGLEDMRGSTSWKWLQDVPDNPLKVGAIDLRRIVERNLTEAMTSYPVPINVPVLILACSDEQCGELYVSEMNPEKLCPGCGKEPR